MEDEAVGVKAMFNADMVDELGGELLALGGVDRPAHDLSTPDIQDHIEVVELPTNRGLEVGDVPAEDLTGAGGVLLLGPLMGRWTRATPVGELPPLPQEPVDRRLRGQVEPPVGEKGDDLPGREVAILGAVDDLKQPLPLRLGELVGGWGCVVVAAIFVATLLAPPGQSAGAQTQDLAGLDLPGATLDSFIDKGQDSTPQLW